VGVVMVRVERAGWCVVVVVMKGVRGVRDRGLWVVSDRQRRAHCRRSLSEFEST
jgi:hypothetical protein